MKYDEGFTVKKYIDDYVKLRKNSKQPLVSDRDLIGVYKELVEGIIRGDKKYGNTKLKYVFFNVLKARFINVFNELIVNKELIKELNG